MKLFLGPQHPGMHGNASVHMYVDGDIIKKSFLLPGVRPVRDAIVSH